MELLKTILVAVDFGDEVDAVLHAAGALAKELGCEVVLAHAVEAEAQEIESLRKPVATQVGQLRQRMTESGANVPQVLCLRGKASAAIQEAAEQIDAHLVILGTRDAGTRGQLGLGTTTEDVIRYSSRPVLAVPPASQVRFANIVCPVDFSDVSARGLNTAIHLARAFGGKLQVLGVITPLSPYHQLDPLWGERTVSPEQMGTALCKRDFDEFLGHFDFKNVQCETYILHGDAADEIVQQAKATSADLIVMGSTGRTGLPYVFMGSTAVKVARQLPAALLTVKRMQVFAPNVAKQLADISAAFNEGHALLAQGFCEEAITRFDQCLAIDAGCADAIAAKAEALDRLGRREQAGECRKLAEDIRRELAEQRTTASVRAEHPFFHRRVPYQVTD